MPIYSGWTALDDGPYQQNIGDYFTTNEEVINRNYVNNGTISLATGVLRLTYFTCRKTESSTTGTVYCGTGAVATPTLIRYGLWTAGTDGALTALVASTANDTALLAVANTAYPKAWSTPYTKLKGTRYAFGVLVVTAQTAPLVYGEVFGGVGAAAPVGLFSGAPLMVGSLTGQADLPSTVAAGSISQQAINRVFATV